MAPRRRLPVVAGRIRDDDIALVRERSPIDDVVREYLQLRPAGAGSLLGLCPFHDEKTPSFHVTPSRGYFFCFGCSEGGDVITFVQKIEQLTFAEAVERLARRAMVELRYEQGGYTPGRQLGQRTRLAEAHREAAEFYAERLSSQEALVGRKFLADRGFEQSDAEHFGVGYAPTGWDTLVSHLRASGYTDRELIICGLAREGQRGPIDRFRGRLVWPIRDVTGETIGFGARRIRDDDPIEAKYLNTPESPLYKKATVLYGVDLAKREIARRQQAVVVEGYTDVMACHLAGVQTAVATCGTSFGEGHIKLLRRLLMDQSEYRGEVIFTFDGDEAGRRAALRAFEEDQKFLAQTFVAVGPGGIDPCELRRQKGDVAVRDLVAGRVPLFEFAIRSVLSRYDLDTAEGRVAALRAAAPMVASIRDRSLRPEYVRVLAGWLGMEIDPVQNMVGEAARNTQNGGRRSRADDSGAARAASSPKEADRPRNAGDAVTGPEAEVEREALKIAVQRPALAGPAFDTLDPYVFRVPIYDQVRDAIAKAGGAVAGTSGPDWVTRLRECAANEEVRNVVTAFAVEPLRSGGEPDVRYADAVLARLQELSATRAIRELKSRLQRLNPVDNQGEYNRLFGELVALEQHRRVLRERAMGDL